MRYQTASEISPAERHQLLFAAELHFDQGLSQKQIAAKLAVHPSTVSRWIAQAQECGFVHVALRPPASDALANALRKHLAWSRVQEIIVAGFGRRQVADAAARYFEAHAHNNATVVLDGGTTIFDFVDSLTPNIFHGLTIVPIAADPPSYAHSAYEAMTRLALKCPALAHCQKPPIWRGGSLDAMHRKVCNAARRADYALLGIGPWRTGYSALDFVAHLGLDPAAIRRKHPNVHAVTGYIPLNCDGQLLNIPDLTDRVRPCLKYADLRQISRSPDRKTIVIAATRQKARPTMAAIKGGICNTLVIDEELAESLLEL